MVKNELGSIYVLGLFLCGLLLFICLYFYFIFQGVESYSKKSYLCREGLLQTQGVLAEAANQLEKLNPRAKKLQNELLRAEKAVIEAPTPYSKAAALAWVAKVKMTQMLFHAKQLAILREAKIQAQTQMLKLRRRIGQTTVEPAQLPFAFREVPKTSLSPSYLPEPFIEEKQRIRLSWRQKVEAPENLKKIKGWLQISGANASILKMQKDCSVSLKKENKWYADLNVGKSFLNF